MRNGGTRICELHEEFMRLSFGNGVYARGDLTAVPNPHLDRPGSKIAGNFSKIVNHDHLGITPGRVAPAPIAVLHPKMAEFELRALHLKRQQVARPGLP